MHSDPSNYLAIAMWSSVAILLIPGLIAGLDYFNREAHYRF